ncbi:hypothetical protein K443DRAFT_335197 [Laccaria amethystina LaAM-08-1]|uniref:Uncharacterized protein n=1 Tax=Laccaria amethystina LaAM-08-1 TaxID=1095629 RepID=A0A0C9YC07_9AGAR|nr:hypothetical protein K443DRAFT_335197 [Laccaria amethystina LaAM-08-1]
MCMGHGTWNLQRSHPLQPLSPFVVPEISDVSCTLIFIPLISVGAKFHSLLDKDNWLLLPDNETLALFSFGTVFPQYKSGDIFNYKFVPLRQMDSVPIHLQIKQDPPISPAFFRTIVHPFDDLPIIRSHLRPHFVIYNAALKLLDNGQYQDQHPTLADSFEEILTIYFQWTAPPTDEFLNASIAPSAPEEEEESDACSAVTRLSVQTTQTAPGRVSGFKKRSRLGDNQDEVDFNEETPTKKSRSVESGGILGVPQLAYDTTTGESL